MTQSTFAWMLTVIPGSAAEVAAHAVGLLTWMMGEHAAAHVDTSLRPHCCCAPLGSAYQSWSWSPLLFSDHAHQLSVLLLTTKSELHQHVMASAEATKHA